MTRASVALAVTFVAVIAVTQRTQEQPSINFGAARISLGMTVEEVDKRLADANQHLKFFPPDKETGLVYVNGTTDDMEGQVTFSSGHTIYAAYQMPNAQDADELAQEIAGAVDSMETKTCVASNYSAHGTGGAFSQSTFECGSRRFNVMTTQILGSNVRNTSVEIEVGQTVAKR